jgi:hypothetical protein
MHRTEWSRACLYNSTRIYIAKSTLAPFAALLCPAALLCIARRVVSNGAAFVYKVQLSSAIQEASVHVVAFLYTAALLFIV